MAYSTINDIRAQLAEDEIVRLTDDEGLGDVVESRIDDAIDNADAYIDAYCGVRYKVPVVPAPDLLKNISVDLAIYGLYSRMTADVPEVRTARHQRALMDLGGLARGSISLGISILPDPSDRTVGAKSNREADVNVFKRKTMEGF